MQSIGLSALFGLLSCSHDAKRANPLDPELTPPVDLRVTLNDTTGISTLSWTPYAGNEPFAAYWVLRNISESTRIDTLLEVDNPQQTTYSDDALQPNTAYVYRVSVINTQGLEQPSTGQRIDGYQTSVIRLLAPESTPESGTVGLTWTRHRSPGFVSYQVYRRTVGTDLDSVLTTIADADDTTFVDLSPRHEMSYFYRVVVTAAGQQLTSNVVDTQLSLPAVAISQLQFASHSATATLSWSTYRGPRFRAYQVQRQSADLAWRSVTEIADLTDTSFTDIGLIGNTVYAYRVIVITERDEMAVSAEADGSIHPLVDTWAVGVEEGGAIRLYTDAEGRVMALISDERRVRLFIYDTDGQLLNEHLLFDNQAFPPQSPNPLLPHAVSMTVDGSGGYTVSLSRRGRTWLQTYDSNADPRVYRSDLLIDAGLSPSAESLDPQSSLAFSTAFAGPDIGVVSVDNILVLSSGERLFETDFESGLPDSLQLNNPLNLVSGLVSNEIEHGMWSARPRYDNANGHIMGSISGLVSKITHVSADLVFDLVKSSMRVGPFIVELDPQTDHLSWTIPGASGTEDYFLVQSVRYRLSIDVTTPGISIESSVAWAQKLDESPEVGALASISDLLIHAGSGDRQVIDPQELTARSASLSEPVSEIRSWQIPGAGRASMGICLPKSSRVLIDDVVVSSFSGVFRWPNAELGSTSLDLGFGTSLPLSFDVDALGRVFVLDAGNASIRVFDLEGKTITEWGSRGTGTGEFDFGEGRDLSAFAGSITVDDDGFIYVADVGNRRIQRFAP